MAADFCIDVALIFVKQKRIVWYYPAIGQNAPGCFRGDVQPTSPVLGEAITDQNCIRTHILRKSALAITNLTLIIQPTRQSMTTPNYITTGVQHMFAHQCVKDW
jgi:hypothetical protein